MGTIPLYHYTLYTIHYTLYTIQYALYTIHYTLYTIHYIPGEKGRMDTTMWEEKRPALRQGREVWYLFAHVKGGGVGRREGGSEVGRGLERDGGRHTEGGEGGEGWKEG
jgi:hypothetical protein